MAVLSMDEIELQIRKVPGVLGVSFNVSEDKISAELLITPATLVTQAEEEVRQIFQHYFDGMVNLQSVGIPPLPIESKGRPTAVFGAMFPGSIRLISATGKTGDQTTDKPTAITLEGNGITVNVKKSISVGNSVLESVRELIDANLNENANYDNKFSKDTVPLNEDTEVNIVTLANGTSLGDAKVNEFINFVKECRIQEAIVEPEVSYSAKVIVSSGTGDALGVSKSYVKEDAEALATLHALLRIISEFH